MRIYLLKSVSRVIGVRCYSTPNYKKVTHCLFDLDGLLLDTELVYKKMITQLCANYGHKYTDELMMKVLGGTEQRLSEILCKELKLPCTPTEFRDQLLVLGDTMLAGAPLLDGAERLIRHLHKTKVPFALATSSSARSVETKIAQNKELFSYFHHMVMGSTDKEVKFGKPHPDIFLVTAARFPDKPDPSKDMAHPCLYKHNQPIMYKLLGHRPLLEEELDVIYHAGHVLVGRYAGFLTMFSSTYDLQLCLVFEDSPHGVTAGLKAGMQTVMVPDPHTDKKLTTHATIVLPTLAKFKPELFGLPAFQ